MFFFHINELGISVPACDNYLQAIGIYKKLIADVFNVISILLLVFFDQLVKRLQLAVKSSSVWKTSRGTRQLFYSQITETANSLLLIKHNLWSPNGFNKHLNNNYNWTGALYLIDKHVISKHLIGQFDVYFNLLRFWLNNTFSFRCRKVIVKLGKLTNILLVCQKVLLIIATSVVWFKSSMNNSKLNCRM